MSQTYVESIALDKMQEKPYSLNHSWIGLHKAYSDCSSLPNEDRYPIMHVKHNIVGTSVTIHQETKEILDLLQFHGQMKIDTLLYI